MKYVWFQRANKVLIQLLRGIVTPLIARPHIEQTTECAEHFDVGRWENTEELLLNQLNGIAEAIIQGQNHFMIGRFFNQRTYMGQAITANASRSRARALARLQVKYDTHISSLGARQRVVNKPNAPV